MIYYFLRKLNLTNALNETHSGLNRNEFHVFKSLSSYSNTHPIWQNKQAIPYQYGTVCKQITDVDKFGHNR